MNWADYAIVATIALSLTVGLWRGFIKEVFALAVWIAALWLAFQFSDAAAELLTEQVDLPSARTAIGFTGIFLAVLLVGALLTFLLGKLVESTGLTGTDRLLGAMFGVVRGFALVVLMILVTGFTPLPRDDWWQESRGIAATLPLVHWVTGFLPDNVSELLDFEAETEPAVI